MPFTLDALRQNAPKVHPARFLARHPGCWIQYYDDTGQKAQAKALSVPAFIVEVARRKQRERCAVSFSLQAFSGTRTKEAITEFRNLGVDVDLIPPAERRTIPVPEIDRRKDSYLVHCLRPFPLRPHWMIETRHGFHLVFRVRPVTDADGIRDGEALNRRLVSHLRGDDRASLLTQVLRVPGTLQFKDPRRPFLCRLLLDNTSTIEPYPLPLVHRLLASREPELKAGAEVLGGQPHIGGGGTKSWRAGLRGVAVGQRNATAASIAGGILCRLPEDLWETAGWGGMKEWNQRNQVPLPIQELRAVFVSIARRESRKRRQNTHGTCRPDDTGLIRPLLSARSC